MATVKYIGAVPPEPDGTPGRVSVPLLDREVGEGQTVDVPDEWLTTYAWDSATWELHASSDDPRTVAELRKELSDRGLPTTGTKSDLIERLATEAAAPTESGE